MVTLLLDKFKGGVNFEDRGDKTHISEEESQTWGGILDVAGASAAQNAYQALQANNVFDNKDFLAADEFTDSNGTNNTVNTGSTTANYDSTGDLYELVNNAVDADADATNDNTVNSSNVSYSVVFSQQGIISEVKTGGQGSLSGNYNYTINIKNPSSTIIATKTVDKGNINSFNDTITFELSDYSEAITAGTYTVEQIINGGDRYYRRTGYSTTQTPFSISSQTVFCAGASVAPLSFVGLDYDSSALVICDSGIKTLDGTEKTICVYADKTAPTNTTLTVDISDGTTTLSAQNLNENIGLVGFSSGTLKLTFNLDTTDTLVSPKIKGYGVLIR